MRRLLIADDDPEIVQALQEMLSPYYDVDTALTGIQVLQCCRRERYTGLILDVEFGPGMNGLEIASRIRARDKAIRIVLFSATDYSDAIRQQAVDVGAAFCEKPLDLGWVRRMMEE